MDVYNMITKKLIDGLYRDARIAREDGWLDDWREFYVFREEVLVPGELECVEKVYRDAKSRSRR